MGPSYVTVRGDRVNIAFKGSEGTNKNFTLYFTFVKYQCIKVRMLTHAAAVYLASPQQRLHVKLSNDWEQITDS